jgi:hypothetical protein
MTAPAPATAPEETMPARDLRPRQPNFSIYIIAEIAHQGSSPNHGHTVSALLVSPSDGTKTESVFDVEEP